MDRFYRAAVMLYRRTYRPVTRPDYRQQYFWNKFPQLKYNQATGRALYEMSVFEWNGAGHTGICYSIALAALCYAKDVLHKSAEIVGIFEDIPDNPVYGVNAQSVFHHAVLKMDGKYYDVFHPEGTDDINDIHYGGIHPRRLEVGYRNPRAPLWKGEWGLSDTYFQPLVALTYPKEHRDDTEFRKHFLNDKPE